MKVLHQTVVTPDQIDHLGHMNVRFYGVAARHGARALLGALGAEPASLTELAVATSTFVITVSSSRGPRSRCGVGCWT